MGGSSGTVLVGGRPEYVRKGPPGPVARHWTTAGATVVSTGANRKASRRMRTNLSTASQWAQRRLNNRGGRLTTRGASGIFRQIADNAGLDDQTTAHILRHHPHPRRHRPRHRRWAARPLQTRHRPRQHPDPQPKTKPKHSNCYYPPTA